MGGLQLVPVATGLSDFEAKLLVAQLGAEGILWQTRGIVDSIYPFGGIDVLVAAGQLDEARHTLLAMTDRMAADPRDTDAGPAPATARNGDDPAVDEDGRRPPWWVALAAVGAVVAFVLVRVLAAV